MSTVYMPGDKITMLPARAVAAFSLDVGRVVPAVSFYADVEADGTTIRSSFSRAERIRVAENLRHDLFDGVITEQALAASQADAPIPFGDALRVLWKLTHALCAQRERVRGKPEPRFRTDFSFYVDRDGGEERVRIVQRRRDAPLDRIVAEMMILANSEWGGLLAQHQVPGIYRSQQNGRVRMTTWPQPHQGLGVQQYVWASSPLRRYVDLVNQRQLLAVLTGGKPPFAPRDAELFSIVSAFDARYSAYLDFQHSIERYWCLRWVAQQGLRRADAVVVREDLVRLADAPLYFRLPGAPSHAPGLRIVVDILGTDEVDLSVEARFVEVAPPRAGEAGLAEELADELAEEALEDGALLEGDAAATAPEAAGGQGSAGGRGEAASQAGDGRPDAAV